MTTQFNDSRRGFMKLLAGVGAGMAFSGTIGSFAAQAQAAPAAGTSIEAGIAYPISTGFDPMTSTGASSMAADLHIFEGLVDLHPATRQPYLALAAKEPEQIDDVTYRITLRDGATFHNGAAVTSEDVVYSFERVLDPNTKSLFAQFVPFIAGVKALDDKTVEFKLKYPFALFKERLTIIKIVPKALIESQGQSAFDANPVGSGPYKFISAVKDDRIVFEAFEAYNGPLPASVAKMTWFLLSDDAARVAAQESGRVQVIENVPYLDADRLKRKNSVESVQSFGLIFLMFNCEKAPFNDKRVRQALQYGINTQKLVDVVFLGNAKAATSYVQDSHPDYVKAATVYDYDPKKAAELLKEAGVTSLKFTTRSTAHKWVVDSVQMILEDWNKLPGVKVDNIASQSPYNDGVDAGNFDALIAPGDPSVFGNDLDLLLSWWYRGDVWPKNRFRWSHTPEYAQVQTLLDEAVAAKSQAEAREIWGKAINIIAEEAALYPIIHRKLPTAWSDKALEGFQPLPTTGVSFLGVKRK